MYEWRFQCVHICSWISTFDKLLPVEDIIILCILEYVLLNTLTLFKFLLKKIARSISYLRKTHFPGLTAAGKHRPVPIYSNYIQIKWHIQNKIGLTHAACFGLLVQVENCVKQPAVWGLCTNGSRVAGGGGLLLLQTHLFPFAELCVWKHLHLSTHARALRYRPARHGAAWPVDSCSQSEHRWMTSTSKWMSQNDGSALKRKGSLKQRTVKLLSDVQNTITLTSRIQSWVLQEPQPGLRRNVWFWRYFDLCVFGWNCFHSLRVLHLFVHYGLTTHTNYATYVAAVQISHSWNTELTSIRFNLAFLFCVISSFIHLFI